jgi:hypothetical protein
VPGFENANIISNSPVADLGFSLATENVGEKDISRSSESEPTCPVWAITGAAYRCVDLRGVWSGSVIGRSGLSPFFAEQSFQRILALTVSLPHRVRSFLLRSAYSRWLDLSAG